MLTSVLAQTSSFQGPDVAWFALSPLLVLVGAALFLLVAGVAGVALAAIGGRITRAEGARRLGWLAGIAFLGEVKDDYGITMQNVRDRLDIKLSDETASPDPRSLRVSPGVSARGHDDTTARRLCQFLSRRREDVRNRAARGHRRQRQRRSAAIRQRVRTNRSTTGRNHAIRRRIRRRRHESGDRLRQHHPASAR